jgi:Zn-dependent M28 family amino/carboxypeptidase
LKSNEKSGIHPVFEVFFRDKSVSLWFIYMFMRKIIIFLLAVIQLSACNKTTQSAQKEVKTVVIPEFSSDSAYKFTQKQVDFGPRVPNTAAHEACAIYLTTELKRFGAEVIEQKADLAAFDGTVLKSTNIIGSFNSKAPIHILLFSHWDSRPWADHDPIQANRKKPVMAANDGASGVGVLLEMARLLGKSQPLVGVDIIFFDSEDYGAPESFKGQDTEDSWCLGTQYWAKNPLVQGYTARFGILLDMVGGKQATFFKEQASEYYAGNVVNNVWSQAKNLGFGQYFVDQKGGAITDDHIYVNKIAGIPSIDIIQYDPNSTSGFGTYWHTTHDTMENVDKNTLKAVGTTLMHVVYNEK